MIDDIMEKIHHVAFGGDITFHELLIRFLQPHVRFSLIH